MKIIPQSVNVNFRRLLKFPNRRIVFQNTGRTSIGQWLSIYCTKSLDKLVRNFQKIAPSQNNKSTCEELPVVGIQDAGVGRESTNDQSWDKNFIAEIEGLDHDNLICQGSGFKDDFIYFTCV